MAGITDIFGPGSNVAKRIFRDYELLTKAVKHCKGLGLKIVLTSGGYDLLHVGHNRYLEKAKENGDILVVGVDSDEKIGKKKGLHRPIVNQDERMEILCHSRHVDIVFLKQEEDSKWKLVKAVRPDVLIATKRVYKSKDLNPLHEFCGEIKLLESQATTSTTANIRRILMRPAEEIKEKLIRTTEEVCKFLDDLTGEEGKQGGEK